MKLNNLPKESEGSLRKGFWFVFRDNENTIITGGSSFSGKEYVYVNGELLSEKRSLKKRSEHYFKIDQTEYKAVFDVQNMLTGRMISSLHKGNEIVKEFHSKWCLHPRQFIFELFIIIILAAFVGGVVGFFNLSRYWLILAIPIFFIKVNKPSISYKIEEINS